MSNDRRPARNPRFQLTPFVAQIRERSVGEQQAPGEVLARLGRLAGQTNSLA